MKEEVLRLLREAKGFLSGQMICDQLHVSRTAVWKVIKQLQEEGYQIEAVRNKGYLLAGTADVITQAELGSCMSSSWCGRSLVYYDETDSTNIRAKQWAENGAPSGALVVAESQTAGRGRRGRSWVSDRGSGIWMSFVLRPELSPASASMLTLVAALAVRAGIEGSTGLETQIKWPNDLTIDGKKICGILTEMSSETDHIHYVVIGIGINVNQTSFPNELENKASSLLLASGNPFKRSLIISSVAAELERYYGQFMKAGDMSLLTNEYNQFLAGRQSNVRVIQAGDELEGVQLGIGRLGELNVREENGSIRTIFSGEVSVRGLDGYI